MQREWLQFTSTKLTTGPFYYFTPQDMDRMFRNTNVGLCPGLVSDILASKDASRGMEYLVNVGNPYYRMFRDFRQASEFKDDATPQLFWIAVGSVDKLDKAHTWEQYFDAGTNTHRVRVHVRVSGVDECGTLHILAVCTNAGTQFDVHKRAVEAKDLHDILVEFFRYEGNVRHAKVGLQASECIRVTPFDITSYPGHRAWAMFTILCSHITYLSRDNNKGVKWVGPDSFKSVLDFTTVQHNCFSSSFRAVFFPPPSEAHLQALWADISDSGKRMQAWTPFLQSRCQSFPPMTSELREFHSHYGRYMGEFGSPWGALGFSCVIALECGAPGSQVLQELLRALDLYELPNRMGWPLGRHAYHAVFGASRAAAARPITTDQVRAAIEAKLVSIRERIPSLGNAKLLSVIPLDPYTKRPALRQAMTPFMKPENATTVNGWFIPPPVPPSIPKPVGTAGRATFELGPGAGGGGGNKRAPEPAAEPASAQAAKRVKAEPTAASVVAGAKGFACVIASAAPPAAAAAAPAPATSAKATTTSADWDQFARTGWNRKFYERVHAGFELCCDTVNGLGDDIIKKAENGGMANEIDCAAMKARLAHAKSQLAAAAAALDEALTVVDTAEVMRGIK